MKNLFLISLLLILFTGCGSVNPNEGTGNNFGFFSGIWDGWTIFFAFIGKMLGYKINIYEVSNNGNWYNLGFLIGVGSWGIISWINDSCSNEDEKIENLEKEIKKLKNKIENESQQKV